MDFFNSALFIAANAVGALALRGVGLRAQAPVSLALSFAFGFWFLGVPLLPWGVLVLLLLGFHLWVEIGPSKSRFHLPLSALFIALLWSDRATTHAFQGLIGWSYLSCRLWSYAMDRKNGAAERTGVTEFLSYLFFFPALLSGPIERIGNFTTSRARGFGWIEGGRLIVIGMIKKNLLSGLVLPYTLLGTDSQLWTRSGVLIGVAAYPLYLYLDFSGYTDLARGLARWYGRELPPNFNLPFLARNIREFWSRWHMSLTRWLTDYLFNPLYTFLLRRLPSLSTVLTGAVAIFATFLLAGVWHGAELKYLWYGAYHGSLLFAFRILDETLKRRSPSFRKSWIASRPARFAGISVTLASVSTGFVLFSLGPPGLIAVARVLWKGGA